MRLVSVTIAKNEGDIIESFVRFNLQWFDHMLVVNHDSSDATGAILKALMAEGLPITVLHDASLAFTQGPTTTRLARRACSQLGADYVFLLDADEYVKCASRGALESAVARVANGKLASLAWQNYVVSETDDATEVDPAKRLRRRAIAEPVPEQKVVLSRGALTDLSWEVSPGNHFLTHTHTANRVAAMQSLDGACIAHFPLRDAAQCQRKALLGWLSHRLQNPIDIPAIEAADAATQNWHLRAMFRDCLSNPEFDTQRLAAMTWRMYVAKRVDAPSPADSDLVFDPLPVGHTLRYTTASSGSAVTALALWVDRLLTRIGEQMN
jgi:Glycosyl transferase family 2